MAILMEMRQTVMKVPQISYYPFITNNYCVNISKDFGFARKKIQTLFTVNLSSVMIIEIIKNSVQAAKLRV